MKSILVLLFLSFFINSVVAQEQDVDLIRKTFDRYNDFLHNGNGKEAANLVDSRTTKYYEDIINLVKDADSLKVESLSLFDKMTVLGIRFLVPKEHILKFDGSDLFIYAVNNGMIDKKNTYSGSLKIGDILVDNDFAKGQIIFQGHETQYYVHFYKETGQWKYDLTSSFEFGKPALQKLVNELGGERGFINALLSLDVNNKLDVNVWNPVR